MRRWPVSIVTYGFLVGFGMCLLSDLGGRHHAAVASQSLPTQPCVTFAVSTKGYSGVNEVPQVSSVALRQTTSSYEDAFVPPPFPPPRG